MKDIPTLPLVAATRHTSDVFSEFEYTDGGTLRDTFAMSALNGLLAQRPAVDKRYYSAGLTTHWDAIAADAYEIAKAMMKARPSSAG